MFKVLKIVAQPLHNLVARRFLLINTGSTKISNASTKIIDLHSAAKDNTIDIAKSCITKDNIWIKNGSGHSPIDLACKYHNLRFISVVKNVLGDGIVRQPFNGRIVSILDIDPDANSIMGVVKDFYYDVV